MAHPYQPMFAFAETVKDLMRGFILRNSAEIDSLDYDRMTRIPDDWVPEGPRYADVVWCIPFVSVEGEPDDGPTHLIVIIKFASEVVVDTGERLNRHAASLLREINWRAVFGAPERPPIIAPIVLYNGKEPWDAPGGVTV